MPDDAAPAAICCACCAPPSAGPRSRRCSSASCRAIPRDRRRAPGRAPARARRAARATSSTARPTPIAGLRGRARARPEQRRSRPTALETLYEQLGRDRELARMLEAARRRRRPTRRRARSCSPASRRCARNRGDVDGAIAAYTAAFTADPTNRDVFTAMERVCYKAERWAAAMQLYEIAIAHVEGGQSRAYRLGDLYARRGNVQLNFLGQIDAAIASYQKVDRGRLAAAAAAVKILEELCQQRDDWQPLIEAYEKRAETQRDPQRKADALRAAAALAARARAGRAPVDAAQPQAARRSIPATPAPPRTLERYYEDAAGQDAASIDVLKLRLQHARDGDESRRAAEADRARLRGGRARRRHGDRALPEDPRAPAREPRRARRARPHLRVDRAVGGVHRRHAQADQGHDRSQHEGAALLQVRLGDGGEVRPRARRDPLLRRRDQDVAERACRPCTACATCTAAARSGRA